MATRILTDVAADTWVEALQLDGRDPGQPGSAPWSIRKRTLRGGRRDGVDLVEVDNGALQFGVCPTRGMGLWTASFGGERVGWRSPIVDGPVNPAFVNLDGRNGLGWLDGFDELCVRCGLDHNGAPFADAEGNKYPLHGRIANIPAHRVSVTVGEGERPTLAVEGVVDEAVLYLPQLRLSTRISTEVGSNRLTVRDTITNRHDTPGAFELLYHWNFGPPHLDEGARFVAPVKAVCPRNAWAAEGIGHYDVYGPPEPGRAEQVYLMQLFGGDDGQTVVMLRNRAADRGVALRFNLRELPCFTLWKSTQGLAEGYVTGLEPAVNYPNPKPIEAARGRVPALAPGGSHTATTTLEVLHGAAAVAAVAAEVATLQRRGTPTIHARPCEPFTTVEA